MVILQLTVLEFVGCGVNTADVELALTMLGVMRIESSPVNKPPMRDVVWKSSAAEIVAAGLIGVTTESMD